MPVQNNRSPRQPHPRGRRLSVAAPAPGPRSPPPPPLPDAHLGVALRARPGICIAPARRHGPRRQARGPRLGRVVRRGGGGRAGRSAVRRRDEARPRAECNTVEASQHNGGERPPGRLLVWDKTNP